MTSESDDVTPHSWAGAALVSAASILLVGTALVDAGRLWLLLIPASYLMAAWAAGLLLDRATGTLPDDAGHPVPLRLSIRIGLGTACLSLLAVLSASIGALWIAGLTGVVLSAYSLFRIVRSSWTMPRVRQWPGPAAIGVPLGVIWLIAWLWGTIPPTFFDELVYHLVIPQRALATGALPAFPWMFLSLMPHASDLLLAWGMMIGSDLGARAMHATLWIACSLAAWGLAEGIARPNPVTWAAPLIAAALATSPLWWFLGTLPFAETCLTLAVITAAALLILPADHRRSWLALGLLLGLAASAKLSGVSWTIAGLAAAFVLGWSKWDLGRAGLTALATVAPWWGRSLLHTGNPVYPMAYRVLGGRYWNDGTQARLNQDLPPGASDLGMDHLITLPLDMVQHPERFGSAADAGILAVSAACLTLALPAATRAAGAGPYARRLGDAAAAFMLVAGLAWVATSTTTRFLAPALVFGLIVLVGMTLHVRPALQAAMCLGLVALAGVGTARFFDQHAGAFSSMDVALGREERTHYLARQVDHYEAARFVREQVPADARLLFIGETRPYYFARNAIAPYPYNDHPLTEWVKTASTPEQVAVRLASEGITHVVLNVREFKRLHDQYGVLSFTGAEAITNGLRLKELPRVLEPLFSQNGVYVFRVPGAVTSR